MDFDNKIRMTNIILVYRAFFAEQHLCIMRAAWGDGGTVVEIQFAPDYGRQSFYHKIQGKAISPNLGNTMVSTRWVNEGEMRFVEKDFIESLPLAPKRVGETEILLPGDPLYFRIISYGTTPGDIIGYFWNEYKPDEFMKLNPGYAKLDGDFKSALAWFFPDWLMEDGHKIDKEWLAYMKKTYPKVRLDQ
jgi:hypothetical protein